MRIFLDANVLVSVLNKEYPLFTYSSRILSLADHKGYEVFTSPLCLTIAFYFAEKKNVDVEQFTGTTSPGSVQGYSDLQSPTLRRFGVNLNFTF